MNTIRPYSKRRTHFPSWSLLPAAALALILAACGGSGSSNGTASSAANLTGSVVDGPISGATVKAFELKSDNTIGTTLLASSTTAADGSYTLTLPDTFSGQVVVIATGGSYCAGSSTAQVANAACPAGTTLTTLGMPLVTVSQKTSGTPALNANVTPVSTAALPSTATVNATTGVVSGTLVKSDFDANFSTVSGGKTPTATPTDLKTLLDQANAMQTSGGASLSTVISVIQSSSTVATAPQANFAIMAGGTNSLMPSTTAPDPTVLVSNSNGTKTSNGDVGGTVYFQPRSGIDAPTLKTIMEDASVTDVQPFTTVNVTVGSDTYTGYKLADVIVRATKFRPADGTGLPGAFGVTTAVVAFGAKADGSTGRVAAFSFTELIRTANGDKTIVAFKKNGADLPASEGAFAIIPGNDYDKFLRKVDRLKEIHIRNDYASLTKPTSTTTPDDATFQVAGAVSNPVSITTGALSTTSSQGYYAVDKIGTKSISSFLSYFFREYGPRHMNYWFGQGVRLTDVLDTAGLQYPADKGSCFVVVTSASQDNGTWVPAMFSCGELYNSPVGQGDGLSGSTNRSRSKGVLLVTDDFRRGTGTAVMMTCWSNISNCTVNNGGDPASYPAVLNTNGNQVNTQMTALVSTEDNLPFQPVGRWFPFSKKADGTNQCNGPTNCTPWIDVGERAQMKVKTMTVYYANGSGNNNLGSSSSNNVSPSGGTLCTMDQAMAGGLCVKSDGTDCTHADYMANPNNCFVKQ